MISKNIYLNNYDASFDFLYDSLRKENNTIRESVAFILGEIGKEEFVRPLCKLLGIRNLDVRKNTLIALGKIGSIDPLEDILKILQDEKSYWLLKKVAIDAVNNIYQRNWYKVKDKKQDKIKQKTKKGTSKQKDKKSSKKSSSKTNSNKKKAIKKD